MNVFNCTKRTLFSFLEQQGYTPLLDEGKGEHLIVLIPSEEEGQPRYFRDLGYKVWRFKKAAKWMDELDCIFCGGLYENLIVFIGRSNVTISYSNLVERILPLGDTPIED